MKKSIVLALILSLFLFMASLVNGATLSVDLRVELTFNINTGEENLEVALDSLSVGNSDISSNGVGQNNLTIETVYVDGSIAESKLTKFSFYTPGSLIVFPMTSTSLDLNYYDDLKFLKVYFNDEEKLSVDISEMLCNNDGICSGIENYYSCSADCTYYEEDGLCIKPREILGLDLEYWEDGYCDLDCYKDDDCINTVNVPEHIEKWIDGWFGVDDVFWFFRGIS